MFEILLSNQNISIRISVISDFSLRAFSIMKKFREIIPQPWVFNDGGFPSPSHDGDFFFSSPVCKNQLG
jgi:hypothetical protein